MKTISKRAVLVGAGILALAACRSVAQPGTTTPGAAGNPISGSATGGSLRENPIDTNVDAGPPAVAKSEPPPRWGTAPEAAGELFSAIDGQCTHLGVSVLENATFVHYGHDAVLGRVTDDAIVVEPAYSKGLGNAYVVQSITGRWPDQAYLVYGNGARCDWADLAVRYDGTKWKNAFALPTGLGVDTVQLYGGGAIGLRRCTGGCGSGPSDCVPGVFMGDNAKAPPIAGDGFQTLAYDMTSTGDVFAVGSVCKDESSPCTTQLRWWSPGTKVGYAVLGPRGTAYQDRGSVLVKSKTEVYVAKDQFFASFDGTKVTKLTAPGKVSNSIIGEAKDGTLWIEGDGKVWQRKADGTYDDITPPSFIAGSHVSGVKQGAPWVTVKNAVYKRIGSAWQKVELPRPPFSSTASKAYLSPESVTVRAPDDVFIVASYFEGQPGWNEVERRRTLLRTKRPKETMRCDLGKGFESWPPPAGDTCTTPFVILSAVSAESPKNYDYPKTRAVLASKVGLVADGAIAEVRENGKIWNGVVPRTLADGRAIAELYARNFPMTRPEVVCAQPTITRTVPIVPKK